MPLKPRKTRAPFKFKIARRKYGAARVGEKYAGYGKANPLAKIELKPMSDERFHLQERLENFKSQKKYLISLKDSFDKSDYKVKEGLLNQYIKETQRKITLYEIKRKKERQQRIALNLKKQTISSLPKELQLTYKEATRKYKRFSLERFSEQVDNYRQTYKKPFKQASNRTKMKALLNSLYYRKQN